MGLQKGWSKTDGRYRIKSSSSDSNIFKTLPERSRLCHTPWYSRQGGEVSFDRFYLNINSYYDININKEQQNKLGLKLLKSIFTLAEFFVHLVEPSEKLYQFIDEMKKI